jgi:hypothetical protein
VAARVRCADNRLAAWLASVRALPTHLGWRPQRPQPDALHPLIKRWSMTSPTTSPNFGPARLRARGTFLASPRPATSMRAPPRKRSSETLASVSALRVSTAAAADHIVGTAHRIPACFQTERTPAEPPASVLLVSVRASLPSDEKVLENRGFPSNLDAPCGQSREIPLVPSPLVP